MLVMTDRVKLNHERVLNFGYNRNAQWAKLMWLHVQHKRKVNKYKINVVLTVRKSHKQLSKDQLAQTEQYTESFLPISNTPQTD